MARQRKSGKPAKDLPVHLGADEYDPDGWPKGKLLLAWHTYALALGNQSCWVAEYEDLLGYFGEGSTVTEALDRLRDSLGPRPHYRSAAIRKTPKKLAASVERKHRAMAAAAVTRAPCLGFSLGGGEGVDAAAAQFKVGMPSVRAARKSLNEDLTCSDGRLPMGASKASLDEIARIYPEKMEMELWVARETPWRLEHAEARNKFPSRNG
jgi:hypothetical protein